MSTKFGPRVISAVVPAKWPNLHRMHIATGVSYPTLSKWRDGKQEPDLEQAQKVAAAAGIELARVLGLDVQPGRGLVRDHPDWPAAVLDAKATYKDRVPGYAYDRAGETSAPDLPTRLDARFAYDLAGFWLLYAPETDVTREETQAVREEMERAEAEHAAKRRSGPHETKPPKS